MRLRRLLGGGAGRRLGEGGPSQLLLAVVLAIAAASSALAAERRIVSLAPSVTETLFAIGAGGELVGVSDFCDFPTEAKAIDRVGSYLTPNVEAIVAKRPDLVIAVPSPGNREKVVSLADLGLRIVVVAEGPTLAHVFEAMRTIAREVGRLARGDELALRLRSEVEATRARTADRPRRRALMIVGRNPLVAVGSGNLVDEILRLAGAENIAGAFGEWPRLSLEFVVKAAPEVVIDGSMGGEATLDTSFYEGLGLDAAKGGRIHALNLDEVLRPGPRIAAGLGRVARLVHPEAFAAAPAP